MTYELIVDHVRYRIYSRKLIGFSHIYGKSTKIWGRDCSMVNRRKFIYNMKFLIYPKRIPLLKRGINFCNGIFTSSYLESVKQEHTMRGDFMG